MFYGRTMAFSAFGMFFYSLSTFIILTVQIMSGNTQILGLPANKSDQSVCKQYHRINATQRVSYIETYQAYEDYRYEVITATRINFRTQNISKWEKIEMCCPGYEPHQQAEDAEKCVPVCPSDCVNGTCNRPNECICDPGYYASINKLTGFSECLPNCSSGCHGGNCIAPEICICDAGYILANNQSSCKASCIGVGGGGLQDCGHNASCIAPDRCKCDDGYAGFMGDLDLRILLNPNETTAKLDIVAKPTFNISNVICKPLCTPECGNNASCIAPNECQCNNGYNRTSSSEELIHCLPNCKQTCINSFCSSPNKCSCYEGYKPHQKLGTIFCEPICQDDCINGKCTQPNNCECSIGYEKLVIGTGGHQTVSGNVCVPVCHGNCPNGRCIAPGQCHCNPGYTIGRLKNQTTGSIVKNGNADNDPINLSLQESCQPLCEPSCPNGSLCIAPNQCESQYDNDKNYNGFPKQRTRVLNDTEDCGQANFSIKDGKSICLYDLNDTTCFESLLCAIIFPKNSESGNQLISLQSIIFLNNGTKESSSNITKSGNNEKLNWWSSRCMDECRILISFDEIPEDVYKEIVDCYELELHNKTMGLLQTSNDLPKPTGQNQTLLCFVKTALTSNTTESKMIGDAVGNKFGRVITGIVGTAIALVFIAGLGVSIYFFRQKLRRISHFNAVSASNDTMMEPSEVFPFNIKET